MFPNVGKSHLLVKNGGKYNFKHSWVMRLFLDPSQDVLMFAIFKLF